MLTFKTYSPEQDMFAAPSNRQVAVLENQITKTKETALLLPEQFDAWREKTSRRHIHATLKSIIDQRKHALQSYESHVSNSKWVTLLQLEEQYGKLALIQSFPATLRFVEKHMLHLLKNVAPGEQSKLYSNFIFKQNLIEDYISSQVTYYQRVNEVKACANNGAI